MPEDDGLFHAKLIRDPEMAIAERGFVLSYAGTMALRQMEFDTVLDMEQNRQNYYH